MEIINYKLIDFLKKDKELISKYVGLLKHIPAKQTKIKLVSMKLKDVEMVKQNINSDSDIDLIEIVSLFQDISKKKVLKLKIIEFFGLINSIKKQLETIARAEENSLTPNEVNVKWEAVNGSERMSKFGIFNTLENLSNGDALQYDDYLEMEYSKIFTILYMRKTRYEIEKDMSKIKIKEE